jgi:hypothetical protein
MKYLIPLILLFACAEPEEIIKYIDKPVYITQTVTKTDTLVTTKEVVKDSIVYKERIVYDTIYLTDTVLRIETRTEIDTVYVPVFVTVVDTVYLERSAKFEYDPVFEEYVNDFLSMTQHYEPLIVDITMIVDNDYGVKSEASIYQGGWLIRVKVDDNCFEACVYRELMHCMFGKGYFDGIMIQNWEGCLEGMDERGYHQYLTDALSL